MVRAGFPFNRLAGLPLAWKEGRTSAGTTEPVYRPSYGCRWCVALATCPTGQRWLTDDGDLEDAVDDV